MFKRESQGVLLSASVTFVHQFYDACNRGDMNAVVMMVHPEFTGHIDFGGASRITRGRDGFLADHQQSALVLEGVHIVIDDCFGVDDNAVACVTVRANQKAPYKGVGGSGNLFVMQASSIFTLKEHMLWSHWEQATVIQPKRMEVRS